MISSTPSAAPLASKFFTWTSRPSDISAWYLRTPPISTGLSEILNLSPPLRTDWTSLMNPSPSVRDRISSLSESSSSYFSIAQISRCLLHVAELAVDAVLCVELVMRATLHDLAVIHNEY